MRQFIISGFKLNSMKYFEFIISLADRWNYHPDDIILMMNTEDPERLAVQPTKENIVWVQIFFANLNNNGVYIYSGETL